MMYSWQQDDWPNFTYDAGAVDDLVLAFSEHVGRVSGMASALSEDVETETLINMMVAEAIKTSEIEGEHLKRSDVMSSIRNNLGLTDTPEPVSDLRARGAADLMIAVRQGYKEPLYEDTLFDWHKMLMVGAHRIKIGEWRTHEDPMQVISGPIGRETVHYEAPPSKRVPQMMAGFVKWFNNTGPDGTAPIKRAPIRSAIAHLYFETIHPFEDGNGRIGRAISEKALSQTLGRPVMLSLSQTIEANKNAYYDALKHAQRSNEITPWIEYFVGVCLDAQKDAERQIAFTLEKTKFFDRHRAQLNERQERVLLRMMEEGPDGFTGGMSPKKYIAITQASKATATRDLQELVESGAMIVTGAGRGTRYWLFFVPPSGSASV